MQCIRGLLLRSPCFLFTVRGSKLGIIGGALLWLEKAAGDATGMSIVASSDIRRHHTKLCVS